MEREYYRLKKKLESDKPIVLRKTTLENFYKQFIWKKKIRRGKSLKLKKY